MKEVAHIYGINPKTLNRWMTRGVKKNQGKSEQFHTLPKHEINLEERILMNGILNFF